MKKKLIARLFAPERLPARDWTGGVCHPDVPTPESEEGVELQKLYGMEVVDVQMDPTSHKYFLTRDDGYFWWWRPEVPAGPNWRLVGIFRTEEADGTERPSALFVRHPEFAKHQKMTIEEYFARQGIIMGMIGSWIPYGRVPRKCLLGTASLERMRKDQHED